jgi:hypothetical protein
VGLDVAHDDPALQGEEAYEEAVVGGGGGGEEAGEEGDVGGAGAGAGGSRGAGGAGGGSQIPGRWQFRWHRPERLAALIDTGASGGVGAWRGKCRGVRAQAHTNTHPWVEGGWRVAECRCCCCCWVQTAHPQVKGCCCRDSYCRL